MSEKGAKGLVIPSSNDWFYKEFKEFHDILNGAEQSTSYEEFISPVFIMNAIERSLESGKEEPLNKIEI